MKYKYLNTPSTVHINLSAAFHVHLIYCQSADPKNSANLHPQADVSAVHTSLM